MPQSPQDLYRRRPRKPIYQPADAPHITCTFFTGLCWFRNYRRPYSQPFRRVISCRNVVALDRPIQPSTSTSQRSSLASIRCLPRLFLRFPKSSPSNLVSTLQIRHLPAAFHRPFRRQFLQSRILYSTTEWLGTSLALNLVLGQITRG